MTLIPLPNGTFAEPPGPTHCANGHELRPPNVSRGYLPCNCRFPERGHAYWRCLACRAVAYRPEHDETGPTPPK